MIRTALGLAALFSALPALAASHALADDAASTQGIYATTAWAAPPSAAPMLTDAAAGDSEDSSSDDVGLLTIAEPATLAMFAAGLLGVLGVGYRRRRG